MKDVVSSPRNPRSIRVAKALPFALSALLLVLSSACLLTTETIYTRPVYNRYTCKAVLMDTSSGELRSVDSSRISTDAPGTAARSFLSYDFNGDHARNLADAELDWRRYLRNNVAASSTFMGRSWCVRPSDTICSDPVEVVWRSDTPPAALPTPELPNCFDAAGPQLEVTAPGLSSDRQLAFPDAAVGSSSTPLVIFTVTNRSSVALRVNAINFIAGGDTPDFVKSSDSCAPTSAEMITGRGHLLGSGATCGFQMQFLPQHRDGIPECMPASPNESCRRRASLSVTGEVDSSRNIVTPVNVRVSGRALGGTISIGPAEICFPTAPALGACTPYQNLHISNTTTGDLTLTSPRLTRVGNRWETMMPFLMSLTLRMGMFVDVPVRFCNVANDPTDGEFTINSSSPTNPTTVVTLVNPLNRRCP
jgi:hypothetical protein